MTEETINKLHELLESKRSLSNLYNDLKEVVKDSARYDDYRVIVVSMSSIPSTYKYELGNLMRDYLKTKIDEINNQIEML